MFRPLAIRLYAQPYVLLVLTALFWAGNAVVGRLAAGVVPPFTLTCVRWILTATILYCVARPMIAESRTTIRQNWLFLAILGTVGLAVFNFSLYGALNFTTAINVTIEQSAMPMVIMLLGFVVFRERVLPAQLIGGGLSILGVLVTATRGDFGALVRLDLNVGDALMVIGVLVYSAYSVALRKKPDLDWRVFMFALATAAAISSIPFAFIEAASGYLPEKSWSTVAILGYVTLFPSLMSQIFFIRGVELVGANRAGLFINLVPVFGAVLAMLILGERFESYHAAGLALVLGGITLAERAVRRRGNGH